jgi:SAM-dependent methyltransferase
MNYADHNRRAWNRNVGRANRWTVPVSPAVVAAARQGRWEIMLTPAKAVPRSWFPLLPGCEVLCLASGGGQQGPILAAAGAQVTVFDLSPAQLRQDRQVAEREGLTLETVEGDMTDLSVFPAERFDLLVHPCSNCFVPDVRPVWREAYRVLRPGGTLLSGFINPVQYIFDDDKSKQGILEARFRIPYSDLTSLSDAERQRYLDQEEPLLFGHTLEDQIGGQTDTGFAINGFYEDTDLDSLIGRYLPHYVVTRARK